MRRCGGLVEYEDEEADPTEETTETPDSPGAIAPVPKKKNAKYEMQTLVALLLKIEKEMPRKKT